MFFLFVLHQVLRSGITIMCLQAFPGHRNTVSCLCFRYGTSELYSGSFDRTVKVWNVEDKAFITENHGHQGEILAIDALRKERALTVGRDRTMLYHKVIVLSSM